MPPLLLKPWKTQDRNAWIDPADRPAGRGLKITSGIIKSLAQQRKLPLLQPHSLKEPELHAQLAAIDADVMVVAAYGLILPFSVLSIPKFGCLNIHASLLPRWRGAAPIQRAILAGDRETGITIMQWTGPDRGLLLCREDPNRTGYTAQLCMTGCPFWARAAFGGLACLARETFAILRMKLTSPTHQAGKDERN